MYIMSIYKYRHIQAVLKVAVLKWPHLLTSMPRLLVSIHHTVYAYYKLYILYVVYMV